MKNFKSPLAFTVICAIMLSFTTISYAQHNHSGMGSNSNVNMNMNQNTHPNMISTKTATIKVWGKCQRRKDRIEKTVLDRGALTADWNVKTKLLTLSYDPAITVLGFFFVINWLKPATTMNTIRLRIRLTTLCLIAVNMKELCNYS